MNILGLIPARGGSKGIPNKNIKQLGTKPLIAYSIEVALESNLFSIVAVSSDSDLILETSKKYDIKDCIKRPRELATDESPTIDTVIHALQFFRDKGIFFDAVCLLQPTSPFRTVQFLEEAVLIFKKENSDSLISVLEVPHVYNPHWVYEANKNNQLEISTGEKRIITRRQNLPKSYIRDGAIYLTKSAVILGEKCLYGKSISYLVSDNAKYVNIDSNEDWKKAENLLK